MRGRRLDRSRAPVRLQWRTQNEPASGDADPGRAIPDLDSVGAREPRVVRLETFVGQPDGPTTRLAQVDSQDAPGHAFARQQRAAIRVKRTTVNEDGVGQVGPVLDRTIRSDFPNIARAFAKGATGCPKRAVRIEGETHGRRREVGKRSGDPGFWIVAVYPIMGIETDENRPEGIDGQILHKCQGWPSDGHADIHRGEYSAVVLIVPFLYFDV